MEPAVSPIVDSVINPAANLSATAILGVIAFFLIRNLPKWIDQHFVALKTLALEHRQEVNEAGIRFATELRAEREQRDRHHSHVIAQIEISNANNLRAYENIDKRVAANHEYAVALAAKLETATSHQKNA
jgi:hypothetical protein